MSICVRKDYSAAMQGLSRVQDFGSQSLEDWYPKCSMSVILKFSLLPKWMDHSCKFRNLYFLLSSALRVLEEFYNIGI